jgi:hypothetical protein
MKSMTVSYKKWHPCGSVSTQTSCQTKHFNLEDREKRASEGFTAFSMTCQAAEIPYDKYQHNFQPPGYVAVLSTATKIITAPLKSQQALADACAKQ